MTRVLAVCFACVVGACAPNGALPDLGTDGAAEGKGDDPTETHGACDPTELPFGGGTGSDTDPHLVCSVEQFQRIGDPASPRRFVLTTDLDFADAVVWSIARFTGHLDGRGHALRNLHTNENADSPRALFIDNAGVIEDLRMEDANVAGTAILVVHNSGLIREVEVSGTLRGVIVDRTHPGGLVGTNAGDIVDVRIDGSIRGGGAIAYANGVGALIAHVEASGTVAGSGWVGGIVAKNQGTIYGARFAGHVEGQFTGGLVGLAKSTSQLTHSRSEADLVAGVSTGDGFVGALAAELEGGGIIDQCAFEGSVQRPRLLSYDGVLVAVADRVSHGVRNSYVVASRPRLWPERPPGDTASSFARLESEVSAARAMVWQPTGAGEELGSPEALADASTFEGFDDAVWRLETAPAVGHPRLRWESDGLERAAPRRVPLRVSLWATGTPGRLMAANRERGLTYPVPLSFTSSGPGVVGAAWLPPGEYDFWVAKGDELRASDAECWLSRVSTATLEAAPVELRGSVTCRGSTGDTRRYHLDTGPALTTPEHTWEPRRDLVRDIFARAGPAMVYDSARQRVVVFGGATSVGLTNDTWEYDGLTWERRDPEQSPPARTDACAVYDPIREKTIVFGGRGRGGIERARRDTWAWDGNDWTQLRPSRDPGYRDSCAMAWDTGRGRGVLFGGYDLDRRRFQTSTWEWTGEDWVQLRPTDSPPPRRLASMAHDPDRDVVVMFGGADDGGELDDLWELDGSTWTRRTTSWGPPASTGAALVYQPDLESVLLIGGGPQRTVASIMWAWDGDRWQRMTGIAGLGHRVVWDEGRGLLVHLGGARRTWDGTARTNEF